jgi:hypothetical protein
VPFWAATRANAEAMATREVVNFIVNVVGFVVCGY